MTHKSKLANGRGVPDLRALVEVMAEKAEAEFTAAENTLRDIMRRMEELEKAGMYPGIPSEQWQSRNGSDEKNYLYMIFRKNAGTRCYEGPEGKSKLYVGCDAERIAEARRMARNRVEYEELRVVRDALVGWHWQMKEQWGRTFLMLHTWRNLEK